MKSKKTKSGKLRAVKIKKKRLQQQPIENYTKDTVAMKSHGITSSQYGKLFDAQRGVCAICGSKNPKDIDHDHNSGRIRGILCSKCNHGLGFLEQWLKRAMEYIQNPPAQRIGLTVIDKNQRALRY